MKTSRRHLQYGSVGCDVIRLTLLMFRLMSCVNKQKSIKSAVRSESETASGVIDVLLTTAAPLPVCRPPSQGMLMGVPGLLWV